MLYRLLTILFPLYLTFIGFSGRSEEVIKLIPSKDKMEVLPGQIVNLPFFAENLSDQNQVINASLEVPDSWKLVLSSQNLELKAGEKKLVIFTLQIPSDNPVGEYSAKLIATNSHEHEILSTTMVSIIVGEVEKIEMHLVQSPEYIKAGEELRSEFLLQNLGNTEKKVILETRNCQIEGDTEILIKPGQAVQFFATHKSSEELTETIKSFFTVRAAISNDVKENIFKSYLIFPVKEIRKNMYFRFPISFSATYLASNQGETYEHAYQFELSGSGFLDREEKHRLDFLARGPNNTNLSFMGMYDQYFVSYANKNIELFAGEKAFSFTPLTEASRFGMGAESRITFNSGLKFGFLYVKPRFYEEINHEMAAFTGFEFNDKNQIELFFITKKQYLSPDLTQLASLNSRFQPLKRTSVELELSHGTYQENSDNALRANINSQFSIINLAANYYYTGEKYPGYFSNSKFYSGNLSVYLTPKINVGLYAKEDFLNAKLDTFFVTAPYSKSIQSSLNYNIVPRTYLRLYWRQYERKDRLVLDKFHYKTNSINTQFNQQINSFEYNLTGEFGKTINYLRESGSNRQRMYRASLNLAYRFNAKHVVRLLGSWSNINRFISEDQQNFMAGFSAVSQLAKNLRANFHLQNAYNIEDYYRNRNLMQLNIDFTPKTKHIISLRSYYTLFKNDTDNPELTFSINYAYRFGIPLKKVVKAGDLAGRVTNENDEPVSGILFNLSNKTSISNSNGEFNFKSMSAGRHLLLIDKSKLAINEIPEIADHFEVEILEDRITPVYFKITKGARFSGYFILPDIGSALSQQKKMLPKNIIIELKNEQEHFRITTNEEGHFSFPLVRPGEWTFRIYTNSLPEGFEVKEPVQKIELKPAQHDKISIELTAKKRKIIFKSENNILQPLNQLKGNPKTEKSNTKEVVNKIKPELNSYYSVQVGAFSKRIANNSDYFRKAPYDFEKQIDNLYKYFIGRFSTLNEASTEQKKLNNIYKSPFVVKFENERLIHVNVN